MCWRSLRSEKPVPEPTDELRSLHSGHCLLSRLRVFSNRIAFEHRQVTFRRSSRSWPILAGLNGSWFTLETFTQTITGAEVDAFNHQGSADLSAYLIVFDDIGMLPAGPGQGRGRSPWAKEPRGHCRHSPSGVRHPHARGTHHSERRSAAVPTVMLWSPSDSKRPAGALIGEGSAAGPSSPSEDCGPRFRRF